MSIFDKLFGKDKKESESLIDTAFPLAQNEEYKEEKKTLRKAIDLMNQERYKEAENSLRKIIEDAPLFIDAHLALGLLFEKTHKDLDAEEEYCEAVDIDSDEALPHIWLGSLLSRQKYRSKQAEAEFREAIKIDTLSYDGHAKLGSLLSETGRFDEAEVELRKAIQINKNVGLSHSFLGALLYDLDREDEALSELELARDLFKKEGKSQMANQLKPIISELHSGIEQRKKSRLQEKSRTGQTRTEDSMDENPWRAKEVLIQLFDICASRTIAPEEKKWQFNTIVDENHSLIFGTKDFLELLETEIDIAVKCEPVNALPYMEVRWKLTHKDNHYREMIEYAQKIKGMNFNDLYGFK